MNIVVGFIRTPQGQAALERAIAETVLRDGHLIVVHSMEGGSHDKIDDIVAYRETLSELDGRLTTQGVPHTMLELVQGHTPAEDLIAVATDNDAALIVIGLRRRSPTGKFLLGSNAQDILLGAPCPVLAVKAPEAI
jgi:nucleotide-binding universal stress UspA family protein